MRSPEFELIDPIAKPNFETIRKLQQKRFIKDGSPLWWSTDHAPDPREYMPFEELRGRLVRLGKCQTTNTEFFLSSDKYTAERDVYLYPEPRVPMTILELDVGGQSLPLLVTVRPYHEKELYSLPFPRFLYEHRLIDELPEFVQSGGVIDLQKHFYPHIRGLFAGKRGNNFFWYPLRINSWWRELGRYIDGALEEKGLSFIELYEPPFSEDRTYCDVWNELLERKDLVDQRRPAWVDYDYKEVSAEEFMEEYEGEQDLLIFYPLRLPSIEATLPLVIATRTHAKSKLKGPIILGIYAGNGRVGNRRREGILRIKNRQLAEDVSKAISEDFGIPVDAVLFIPQKGRPRYERVLGE